jgi:hypothetical protein
MTLNEVCPRQRSWYYPNLRWTLARRERKKFSIWKSNPVTTEGGLGTINVWCRRLHVLCETKQMKELVTNCSAKYGHFVCVCVCVCVRACARVCVRACVCVCV